MESGSFVNILLTLTDRMVSYLFQAHVKAYYMRRLFWLLFLKRLFRKNNILLPLYGIRSSIQVYLACHNSNRIYNMELKNIDTEHTALQTEYDSIKSALDKNIERNFKLYS